MRFAYPPKNQQTERLPYNAGLILLVVGSFWRRRFVTKFAVSNLATGVSNVATDSQSRCPEQDHRDYKWYGRFWPLHRHGNGSRAQNRERIENVDELLSAMHVLVEPGTTVFIGYGQNTVIRLFTEFEDRPSRDRTDNYER